MVIALRSACQSMEKYEWLTNLAAMSSEVTITVLYIEHKKPMITKPK
jgi:hypothetical protein